MNKKKTGRFSFCHVQLNVHVRCALFTVSLFQLMWVSAYSQPEAQWANASEGLLNDRGNSIAADGSGNVYVVGLKSSDIMDFGNGVTLNDGDFFVVKYNGEGEAQWARSAGGMANSVGVDVNENVYVTGTFSSSSLDFGNGITVNNTGQSDMFLVKYNSNGIAEWARVVGGTAHEYGNALAVSDSGNVYVTGGFNSEELILMNLSPVSHTDTYGVPNDDVFVVKYDSSGTEQWAKNFLHVMSYSYSEAGQSITIDPFENIFIFGYSDIKVSFIFKLNSDGSLGWVTGKGLTQSSESIASDSEGNVYITGMLPADEGDNIHMFVNKYDNARVLQWSTVAEISGDFSQIHGKSLAVDGSGNVYITGFFIGGNIDFGNSVTADISGVVDLNTDVFLVRYNSDGIAQWADAYGTSGNDVGDEGQAIAIDDSDNVYITGGFRNSTLDFGNGVVVSSSIERDMFVAKFAPSNAVPLIIRRFIPQVYRKGFEKATIDVSEYFSDPDGDELTFYAESENREVVSATMQGSLLIIGERGTGNTVISLTAEDPHGAKASTSFKVTVSEGKKKLRVKSETETVMIYPNPMDSQLQIGLTGEHRGDLYIRLLDMTGKVLDEVALQKKDRFFQYTLDVSGLPKGAYLLDVKQGPGRQVMRVIK